MGLIFIIKNINTVFEYIYFFIIINNVYFIDRNFLNYVIYIFVINTLLFFEPEQKNFFKRYQNSTVRKKFQIFFGNNFFYPDNKRLLIIIFN